jgi:deazaflavin-dependent oxidoreductase (nitroreductase family)
MTEPKRPEPADRNSAVIAEFRANGGKVDHRSQDILLLHHTGARTGTRRVTPLAYLRVGDSLAVFASKAGAPMNPGWYHNLLAHPETTVEVGTETIKVRARVAEPAERDVIWEQQTARLPHFAEYEKKAAPRRRIPVVLLESVK